MKKQKLRVSLSPVLLHSWRQRERCVVACSPTKRFGPGPPAEPCYGVISDHHGRLKHIFNIFHTNYQCGSYIHIQAHSSVPPPKKKNKKNTKNPSFPETFPIHQPVQPTFLKPPAMGPPPLAPALWRDHSWSREWRPGPRGHDPTGGRMIWRFPEIGVPQ